MNRTLLIGGGLLATYYLLAAGGPKDTPGFKYNLGAAARGILSSQVALGFHPCGIGWAVQRTKSGKYTVALWSLEGNDLIPGGGGLKRLRVKPAEASPAAVYTFIAPGMQGYTSDLPLFEFDDVVSAGNSVSASASMLVRENGATVEEATKCVETPAVAKTGKIPATGVTTIENWTAAGGEDLL